MATVYFDNAATSFPKPRCVLDAALSCAKYDCGNAGRGSHALALASAERIYRCRESIATFFGADDPLRVIFTLNATYAINFLLKGTLRDGDHVLISDLEHNAVLRPLEQLKRTRGVSYSTFSTQNGDVCADILSKYRPATRVLICTHQSNICSHTLPLERIGALCARLGILFFVDAAQSAGHLPIDMQAMHISALCAPGHKGLLGLQGCGFCILGPDVQPDTLIEGGSGYHSFSPTMPDEFPERGEAGTLPTPIITSLEAGIEYLRGVGTEHVREHELALYRRLAEQMSTWDGYDILLPQKAGSVLSFRRAGMASDDIGNHLAKEGICVRSGYHCAPLAHKTLGTDDGGTVRVSFGLFNTPAQVDALCRTLRQMEFLHEVAPRDEA
ncbi:MAG: aminotransferase class V-fold PLP-dependent enzyme [Clostridia bacterium]|nr:aminotransferase class V-fold PLP-dependent enzyme [Clostridia bacterium]